jgi:hypothetical protein
VAQHARAQVALAAEGVDQRRRLVARHRVDREVAPPQVVLERHVGRAYTVKPL